MKHAQFLIYNDDLTAIKIINTNNEDELDLYDNYLELNDNLKKQLKQEVKKL